MASNNSQYPPRTSSRWPAPGIFVNVEFGVSFSPNDPPHTKQIKYTSRNMQERLYRQQYQQHRQQQHQNQQQFHYPGDSHPATLFPTSNRQRQQQQYPDQPRYPYPAAIYPESSRTQQRCDDERPRRLGVSTRSQHERGSSAPPTMTDRNQPISPVSPITPFSPLVHRSTMPSEQANRPLPPVPSRFRLGEADLPWSTPPWYRPQEPELASPTVVGIELEERRLEDPQRVRELEELHQAMMTVDSLDHDGWESWTWDSVGDIPRGPRSLGWAVRSSETVPDVRSPVRSPPRLEPPPPPYVVSQWEQALERSGGRRPRSAYS
ncbi:hypothetical protein BGZ60DRAFT_522300 [Tricladium varicosporioides]|nr:hypothetical protein BGZ60DRAFT_522300 [Hymenoscyphus varicosporioides]